MNSFSFNIGRPLLLRKYLFHIELPLHASHSNPQIAPPPHTHTPSHRQITIPVTYGPGLKTYSIISSLESEAHQHRSPIIIVACVCRVRKSAGDRHRLPGRPIARSSPADYGLPIAHQLAARMSWVIRPRCVLCAGRARTTCSLAE